MTMQYNSNVVNRPLPTFFDDAQLSFSTKKARRTPYYRSQPRPAKTAPPISRLFPHRWLNEKPQAISFKDHSESFLSKHYNESSRDLYFDQCFAIESKIGQGSFGEVFCVRSKEDGRLYAVKRAWEAFRSASDRLKKLSEVQKHEQLPKHANLVEFIKAWEERGYLYIQTELCLCSLSDYSEQNHHISEDKIWEFLIDLLAALQHLHDRNLIHLDIKPENIFVSHDGLCKLGDFGLVFDLNRGKLDLASEGDAKYMAPELLDNKFGKQADIFSLGMSILELATDLDPPHTDIPWQQLRNGMLPDDMMGHLSPDMQYLIRVMMHPDPYARPSATQLLNMPCVAKRYKRRRWRIAYCKTVRRCQYIFGLIWLWLKLFVCLLRLPLIMHYLIHFFTFHSRSRSILNNSNFSKKTFLPKKSSYVFDVDSMNNEDNTKRFLNFDHSFSDDEVEDISSIPYTMQEDCENISLPKDAFVFKNLCDISANTDVTDLSHHSFLVNDSFIVDRPWNSTPAQKNKVGLKFRPPLPNLDIYGSPSQLKLNNRSLNQDLHSSYSGNDLMLNTSIGYKQNKNVNDDDFLRIPPKNLMEVFESTSSDEDTDIE